METRVAGPGGIYEASREPERPTLGELLARFELFLVDVTGSPRALERTCAGVALAEAPYRPERYADQIVLGLGIRRSDASFAQTLSELTAARALAIVVREERGPAAPSGASGSGDPALKDAEGSASAAGNAAEIADDGPAIVTVRADADWVQLAQVLRAANTAYSPAVATGTPIGDLFALANTLAALMDAAVSIVDVPGRVLGYSTHASHPIDEVRRESTLALEEMVHPSRDADYQELTRSAGAVHFVGHDDQLGRVAIAVRSAGEMLGTVWAVQVDPDGWQRTAALLESVEPLVALHMAHSRTTATAQERRSSDLLRTLFEDEAHATQAATELAIGASESHTVVCFGLDEAASSNPVRQHQQLLHLTEVSAGVAFSWSRCAMIGSLTVALVASDDPDAVRSFAAGVVHASSGMVRAGIGGRAGSVPEIARSYREGLSAHQALLHPMRAESTLIDDVGSSAELAARRTATFDDVRVEIGLARVGEFLADRGFTAADELERIRAYDLQNGTDYEATLAVFLNTQGSIRETAAQLHLHQNTVRYRIERLGAELGIRLGDPATRLWLWLRLMTERELPPSRGRGLQY